VVCRSDVHEENRKLVVLAVFCYKGLYLLDVDAASVLGGGFCLLVLPGTAFLCVTLHDFVLSCVILYYIISRYYTLL
jgi:hypothetical protein